VADSLRLPNAVSTASAGAPAVRRPRARRRAVGRVLRAVRLGASAALLVAVLVIAVVTVVLPRITGSTPLTVLTSSMEPTLPPGTLVVVQPVDASTLAVGDVVTYQLRSGEPTLVTHRIVSIAETADGERSYVLQGDNNPDPDIDAVVPGQVQGRVAYAVPLIGYVNSALSGEGRAWIVGVGAALLFGYAAYAIVGGALETARRRRGRGNAARRRAH